MKKKSQYNLSIFRRFWNVSGQPYSFLLPALIVFVFIVLSPVVMSLILSFYKFTGFDDNCFLKTLLVLIISEYSLVTGTSG